MAPAAQPSAFENVRVIVGLFAGVAALIYLTGGAVLGLRLLLAGLPGFDVVGQLPREFLFSLGATQVVAPAVLVGTAWGVIEFTLNRAEALFDKGHLGWNEASLQPKLRRTYLLFYVAAPLLLLAPGTAVVLARGDVKDEGTLLIILGAVTGVALVAWLVSARASRLSKRRQPQPAASRAGIRFWEQLFVLSGVLVAMLPAVWVAIQGDKGAPWTAYLTLPVAWAVTFLVMLAVVFLRGQVGERYRKGRRRNMVLLPMASCSATADPRDARAHRLRCRRGAGGGDGMHQSV
jgi:hypothetical protein